MAHCGLLFLGSLEVARCQLLEIIGLPYSAATARDQGKLTIPGGNPSVMMGDVAEVGGQDSLLSCRWAARVLCLGTQLFVRRGPETGKLAALAHRTVREDWLCFALCDAFIIPEFAGKDYEFLMELDADFGFSRMFDKQRRSVAFELPEGGGRKISRAAAERAGHLATTDVEERH